MKVKPLAGWGLIAIGSMLLFQVISLVAAQDEPDLTRLPIGDGKVSTEPQVGYVWSCQTEFNANAGGASKDGPWINDDGTFDYTAKAVVDGDVSWDGQIAITLDGDNRIITGNGLPTYHTTGVYGISSTDDAYEYDQNPNSIAEQANSWTLPANPTLADQPSCVPMGAIGVMLSGPVVFNALDGRGRDAAAHETLDHCEGHPERTGAYHYHNLSDCVSDHEETDSGHSALMGYALDGFGIYGHHGEDGEVLTSEDLDECHGHTHLIEWDGETVEMYHYHATYEYPYTIGCYRGTPTQLSGQGQPPQNAGGQPGQGPDLAAAAARLGITEQALRNALGAPPPNLEAAAAKLGITEQALRDALGAPPGG